MLKNIINLDEYKKYLTDYYNEHNDEKCYSLPNINKYYTDDYLLSILENTYNFSLQIVESMENKENVFGDILYYEVELGILNFTVFDASCDTLCFVPYKENTVLISTYILKKALGDEFDFDDRKIEIFDYENHSFLKIPEILININSDEFENKYLPSYQKKYKK